MKLHPKAVRILLLAAAGAVVLGALAATGVWMYVCHGDTCPSIAGLEKYEPRQTSRLYAADGRLIAAIGTERRTLAKLDQIPKQVQDAFVITEDKRFYQH
ncbi:MAG TPA: transglycosylase domain-containing protein, partial [Gemmatimonadaceae bacterium]